MLHLDWESFSEVDITKAGHWRYALDPSTEILCLAYAFDDGEVKLWKPGEPFPKEILYHVAANEPVGAHNAPFEYAIWNKVLGRQLGVEVPGLLMEQVHCSAVLCSYYALPRSLEHAASALRLDAQKDKEGHRIMLKLSKPRKPSKNNPATRWTPESAPEDFKKLYAYCIQDVRTEVAVFDALPPLPEKERQLWLVDQSINERGFYCDIPTVQKFVKAIEAIAGIMNGELETITDGEVHTVNQRDVLLHWLQGRKVKIDNLQRKTLVDLVPHLRDPFGPYFDEIAADVIDLRLEAGRSSTAKFYAMLKTAWEDYRIRGAFVHHSASTGRWGGSLVQPHNLPRGELKFKQILEAIMLLCDLDSPEAFYFFYPKPFTTAASCIRAMVAAAPGKELFVGDYSAIEACGVAWIAGQDDLVDDFAQGKPVYKNMAAEISPDATRQLGKQIILGAGYGMSATTFKQTCLTYGMVLTGDLAKRCIDIYREKYKKIVQSWRDTERAAVNAMKNPGRRFTACKCTWRRVKIRGKLFLSAELPSGKLLFYPYPKLVEAKTPWGSYKEVIEFSGVYQGKEVRETTYGGKLVENLVQAICRELLAEALQRCEYSPRDFPPILHVHDEVGAEVDAGRSDEDFEEFIELLEKPPSWSVGFPINVKGWRGREYRKD